ncbi:hypothetical protein OG339_49055 (plasmid) [Streptosporangium sp. NBC_01495]|uniref:hypothetical protein n=1 Tax=Streptosporangium sp. NBC_01495 TaxID=2903899 RepID=UPI002E302A6C|nr:hypothetical protein [Streptosporangium sp. NBC_01495]
MATQLLRGVDSSLMHHTSIIKSMVVRFFDDWEWVFPLGWCRKRPHPGRDPLAEQARAAAADRERAAAERAGLQVSGGRDRTHPP